MSTDKKETVVINGILLVLVVGVCFGVVSLFRRIPATSARIAPGPYTQAAAALRQEYDVELARRAADHGNALRRLAEMEATNCVLLAERNALLEERDVLLVERAQAQRALEELREIDGEAACRLADKINPVWSFSFAFGQGFARGRAGRTDVPTTAEVGRAMLDSVLSVVPSETTEPWQPKDPLPDAGRSPALLDPGVWPRSL